MKGISRRQYAKRRGVSERSIRRAIEDGRIAASVLPDGMLDSDQADGLLAVGSVTGAAVPPKLADARRRKLAATVALLADDLDELERSVLTRAVGEATDDLIVREVARQFLALPDELAPKVAGLAPAIAAPIVEDAVRDALNRIADKGEKLADDRAPTTDVAVVAAAPDLASMSATQLAAMKADLQARKLEIERGLKRRELMTVDEWERSMGLRMTTAKHRVCGLHYKTASRFDSATVDGARSIIRDELCDIIYDFARTPALAKELIGEPPAESTLKTKHEESSMTEQEVRDIAIGIARRRLETYPAKAAAAIDAARKEKGHPLTVKAREVVLREAIVQALDGFEAEGWAILEARNATNEVQTK